MTEPDRLITVQRLIPAPPERIFDILADPRRHPEIDGSGTVKQADVDGPERLSEGARFGMAMKLGFSYRMVSTVTEFAENERIAWAPRPEVRGKVKETMAGRVYRYELQPTDGGTLVRETWDATAEQGWFMHKLLRTPAKVRSAMEKTLERLEQAATGG